MFEIQTSAIVNTSVKNLWNCLTKTEKYATWNKFITEINGVFCRGQQIKIKLLFPDKEQMIFKPICTEIIKNKEIRWVGNLWFDWIFRGEHYFLLNEVDDKTTELIHGEIFSGILSSFFKKKRGDITCEAFKVMNNNLVDKFN